MAKLNLLNKIFNAGPLILLYYLSISEIDTNLEKVFEIFFYSLSNRYVLLFCHVNVFFAAKNFWLVFLLLLELA